MAITGTPASGTITVAQSPSQAAVYAGQNVIIPNAAAGIGDIVFKIVQNNVTTIKVMAGSTYNHSALTLGDANNFNTTTNVFTVGPMAGYTLMGVIYGFEEGGAMVVAPTGASKQWLARNSAGTDLAYNQSYGSNQASLPANYSTTGVAGPPRRRDKVLIWCVIMNIARFNEWRTSNSSQPDATDPLGSTYTSWPSKAKFEANTTLKNKYGTYEKYMATAKPFGSGDGSVFSHKWHVGKANGAAMGGYNASSPHNITVTMNGTSYTGVWYPAANYCYNYGAGGGLYWLPDMVELRQLMTDATLTKVNNALKLCGSQISAASNVWSSVRRSATNAWVYNSYGISYNDYFGHALHARPVTLLKI